LLKCSTMFFVTTSNSVAKRPELILNLSLVHSENLN
jgi:hypothetical protein